MSKRRGVGAGHDGAVTAATGPLIRTEDLVPLLGSVTLLDVRYRLGGPGGPAEFESGHLPGARYVDLGTALAAAPGAGGRHPLPDPAVFGAAMRAAGVHHDRPVVVYDDWAAHAAARCWWLLRHHGHDDVRVLDGGLAAWRAAGGPLETGPAGAGTGEEPGDFVPGPGRAPVAGSEDLPAAVASGRVLLDARAPERFRGEVEPVDPVAGHIPGAVNAPTAANLAPDGRFHEPADLRARFEALGVAPAVPGVEAIASCGSGVTACHDLLALAHAGLGDHALHPDSWSGWITDPARPIARG